MEKMRMESNNLTEKNIERIGELFPSVITEVKDETGKIKRSINFALLKQLLSDEVVDGDEAYELTWAGKRAAIIEAGKPIRKTLRPCKEESKYWDNTENLYIEGDNLDVLKLLQESYLGSIKMIYIDPPYNTGSDFIYRDKFSMTVEEYDEISGAFDENSNRLFQNNESNGRFHSDWCSMIYSRLQLARNLLSDDGVIYISIDDNELANMIKIVSEIFGEHNILACVTRPTGTPTGGGNEAIVNYLDYVLVVAKNAVNASIEGLPMTEEDSKIYDMSDEYGRYLIRPLRRTGGEDRREDRPSMFFGIKSPDGTEVFPIGPTGYESRWICGKKTYDELVTQNRIYWKSIETNGTIEWKVYQKFYLENRRKQPSNLWSDLEGNKKATRECKDLFDGEKVFDYPKPVDLIKRILSLTSSKDYIVLDFFSGSATTAHAVIQMNATDNGKRKFIMVQVDEKIDETKDAYRLGYKKISEIGKERIRRAGEKIKQEAGLTAQDLDVGFRVLKLDSTSMKDVYYSADQYSQGMLAGLESNIKEDRTDLDLLFGCLLEWGLPLSLPHVSEEIYGVQVHTINDGDLIACFAQNVSEAVVKEIAKRQPLRAVFRDNSFANSPEKINVEEIFKLMAPNTSVKVL